MTKTKKRTKIIKLVFGLALLLFIAWKIASSLKQTDLDALQFSPTSSWMFLIALVLMPVNWLLESLKWHLLVKDIEKTSFTNSIVSVLAGISTGLLTPNRIGNFIGRTMSMEKVNRTKGILATIHSNLAQFSASVLFGVMSLLFLGLDIEYLDQSSVNVSAILILIVALSLYYFPRLIDFNPISKLYSNQMQLALEHLQRESFLLKTTVLFVSITRYLVFLAQFYLLLNCFPINVASDTLILAIALVYLITTIIPSFLFGKLFIREASALFVLEGFGIESSIILVTAFLLWFINLAIPSLAGAVILFKSEPKV
ncbi:MAG: flippase-like domain-containing protein [Crocinitomicaceae bacterium]|nr:flippase-like domain-containing protein [Crocinitomicaceae bacterium]